VFQCVFYAQLSAGEREQRQVGTSLPGLPETAEGVKCSPVEATLHKTGCSVPTVFFFRPATVFVETEVRVQRRYGDPECNR
jgi:hypothetical protein